MNEQRDSMFSTTMEEAEQMLRETALIPHRSVQAARKRLATSLRSATALSQSRQSHRSAHSSPILVVAVGIGLIMGCIWSYRSFAGR